MPKSVMLALISLLTCLAMLTLPVLTFILAICWGISLLLAGLLLNQKQLAVILGLNVMLLYGLSGDSSLFFYLSFFGLPFMVMSFLANKDVNGYYDILKRGLLAAVIGVTFFMGFMYFTTGGVGTKEIETQMDNYFRESWPQYEKTGALDYYQQRGFDKQQIKTEIDGFIHSFARHLPAFYYLEAIIITFLTLYFSFLICRKRRIERLIKKPYTEEIMPWQGAWVVIAGLGLWLWGRDNNAIIYFTGSNILTVCVPITIYFGFSAIFYKIKQQKTWIKKWVIAGIIILSLFFTLSMIMFTALVGVFDSLIDYRKLRNGKEE